jgi:hypothetical protein
MDDPKPRRKAPWDDDPRLGHYIDDNALYVLDSVARGHLSGRGASNYFYIASWHPLEWDIETLVRFLVKTAEEYDIVLKNFSTMTYAFEEEYEKDLFDPETKEILPEYESVFEKYFDELDAFEKYKKENGLKNLFDSIDPSTKGSPAIKDKVIYPAPKQPKFYVGAYKWALDKIKESPQSSEGTLFAKIFSDKFDLYDLKEVMKISDQIVAVNEPEDSERFMAKKICDDILNWTSFEVEPSMQNIGKLQKDLDAYLDKFTKNQLVMTSRDRKVGDFRVLQNLNIFTFNKHMEMILEQFKDMHKNYGHTFVFENPYEKILPHDRDDEESLRQRYATRQFLFKHMILALHKLGYIKIFSLGNNWHWTEQVEDFRDTAKIELLSPLLEKFEGAKAKNLAFNPDKLLLHVRGKELKIRKNSDQFRALKIIFFDPKLVGQEWFFDDITDQLGEENNDKRYYNATYQINQKLRGLGLPDFFVTTRHSAKINPEYLS